MVNETSFKSAALLCIELWRESFPAARFTSYSAFTAWLFDLYFENRAQCPEPVSSLLQVVTYGQDATLYEREALLEKLKKKRFCRLYREVATEVVLQGKREASCKDSGDDKPESVNKRSRISPCDMGEDEIVKQMKPSCSRTVTEEKTLIAFSASTLPVWQIFPGDLCLFLASKYGDPFLYFYMQSTSFEKWETMFQEFAIEIGRETLLEVDASCQWLMVGPLTIKNGKGELVVFAGRSRDKGDEVCLFFGSFVYEDRTKTAEEEEEKTGESSLDSPNPSGTVPFYRISSQDAFTNSKGLLSEQKEMQLVGAPFCAGASVRCSAYYKDAEECTKYKSPPTAIW